MRTKVHHEQAGHKDARTHVPNAEVAQGPKGQHVQYMGLHQLQHSSGGHDDSDPAHKHQGQRLHDKPANAGGTTKIPIGLLKGQRTFNRNAGAQDGPLGFKVYGQAALRREQLQI
jgi:hypothetical protein